MEIIKVTCGDANPKGNISFTFKGGCREELDIREAYRCTGCGGWFHLDCILKHFELEEGHDVARNCLKKILDISLSRRIIELCQEGLKPNRPVNNLYIGKIK